MSCKTLLNYAVSFNQVQGTNAASLAFLRRLGVVCTLSTATPPTAVITTPTGDDVIPAVITLSGTFPVGYVLNGEFTSDVQPGAFEAPLTITSTSTASEAAIAWADLIKGIDQLTATAVGDTIEILAFPPGTSVAVANVTVTAPEIVEVTDPEDLPYLTEQYADIQGAFDGGLTSVYLILTDDALEIPALLFEKECEFYTVYGSRAFTEAEYLTAFAGWLGVKGFSTHDQVLIEDNANGHNQCIFFEDTGSSTSARAYYGIFSFGSLLAASQWRNQQYVPINEQNGAPVESLGLADALFEDRGSFYLTDEEQGTRLAFFVAGGKSITTPYINKEIETLIQSDMLSFLSTNQPYNIETSRRLLQQIGNKVVLEYLDDGLLDPDGINQISITNSNETFIVDGELYTTEAVALWRVKIDAYNLSL